MRTTSRASDKIFALFVVLVNVSLSFTCNSALAASSDTPEASGSQPSITGSVTRNEVGAGASTVNLDGTATQSAREDAQTSSTEASTTQSAESPTMQSASQGPLKGKVTRKHSPGFGLFGRRWTTEDYRSLNYGILGIIMVKLPFSRVQRVLRVFPDCPAMQAGIKPGDVVVKIADHVVSAHETQKSTWHTADGVAGTHVDYTVRRHNELLTFDLTRMNIEDVQNDKIRHMYEQMLRELGPPGSIDKKKLYSQPSE